MGYYAIEDVSFGLNFGTNGENITNADISSLYQGHRYQITVEYLDNSSSALLDDNSYSEIILKNSSNNNHLIYFDDLSLGPVITLLPTDASLINIGDLSFINGIPNLAGNGKVKVNFKAENFSTRFLLPASEEIVKMSYKNSTTEEALNLKWSTQSTLTGTNRYSNYWEFNDVSLNKPTSINDISNIQLEIVVNTTLSSETFVVGSMDVDCSINKFIYDISSMTLLSDDISQNFLGIPDDVIFNGFLETGTSPKIPPHTEDPSTYPTFVSDLSVNNSQLILYDGYFITKKAFETHIPATDFSKYGIELESHDDGGWENSYNWIIFQYEVSGWANTEGNITTTYVVNVDLTDCQNLDDNLLKNKYVDEPGEQQEDVVIYYRDNGLGNVWIYNGYYPDFTRQITRENNLSGPAATTTYGPDMLTGLESATFKWFHISGQHYTNIANQFDSVGNMAELETQFNSSGNWGGGGDIVTGFMSGSMRKDSDYPNLEGYVPPLKMQTPTDASFAAGTDGVFKAYLAFGVKNCVRTNNVKIKRPPNITLRGASGTQTIYFH